MRKLVAILVMVFSIAFTTQAQQKRGEKLEKRPKLSVEQHTDLALKKMTLALDLTEKQQNQIKPLLKMQAQEKKAAMEKRKEMRENRKRPTADEMYAMQAKKLDNQIAMKNSMKRILDKEQFEKFEKMARARKAKAKKGMKRRAMRKHRPGEGQ